MTVKSATRTFYSHTRRNLEAFLGAGRVLRTITSADADAFRAWLVEHEQVGEDGSKRQRKLSPATVARRIIAARTMWRKAVRWKLANENPFSGVKAGHQLNDARKAFVTRDVIDAVMDACPDDDWRAIIALSRYGGLRCHLAG
jgi:integrase